MLTRLLFIMIIMLVRFTINIHATHHRHRHCESTLRHALVTIDCDTFETSNECAREVRRIVNQSTCIGGGAWAAIVVRDIDLVDSGQIDWSLNTIAPHPTVCRVITNNRWMIEVFRTGHRRKAFVNDQYGWIERQSMQTGISPTSIDLCPLSFMRQFTSTHNISASDADRWRQLMADEYGGSWNVLVARLDDVNRELSSVIGFSFPHYVYDGKAGFCINKTPNGFYVNIAKVGYSSSDEERDSLAR